MLYSNFVKKIRKTDPDFDEQVIDRTLEPDEALRQLQSKHHLRTESPATNYMKDWRNSLYDYGVKHPSMQSFVMRQEKPPSQEDMDLLTYVMGARPHKNIQLDMKRRAKPARTVRQYAKYPNRYDVPGVDTPGSTFDADLF